MSWHIHDDGKRASVGKKGAVRFFPCGHPRSAENIESSGREVSGEPRSRCRECRRRLDREKKARGRKARADFRATKPEETAHVGMEG